MADADKAIFCATFKDDTFRFSARIEHEVFDTLPPDIQDVLRTGKPTEIAIVLPVAMMLIRAARA